MAIDLGISALCSLVYVVERFRVHQFQPIWSEYLWLANSSAICIGRTVRCFAPSRLQFTVRRLCHLLAKGDAKDCWLHNGEKRQPRVGYRAWGASQQRCDVGTQTITFFNAAVVTTVSSVNVSDTAYCRNQLPLWDDYIRLVSAYTYLQEDYVRS